jgi:RimJ/RimL family protein N-acetyltransferase
MPSPKLPIETSRLTLRPFAEDDLQTLMAYHSLPEVQRYLDWKARDRVEARQALANLSKEVALTRPGDTISLAVVRKSDGELLGHISLRWLDATAGQAELRFVFDPKHSRQGYGTEAVRAAMTLGFEEFKFHRIFARCDARNQGSARLMKKIGMRLEAHYREHVLFQGEWDEELHFAILDREWKRDPKIADFPIQRVA